MSRRSPDGVTPEQLRASLRPLLDLPIELKLLARGDPSSSGVVRRSRDALSTPAG